MERKTPYQVFWVLVVFFLVFVVRDYGLLWESIIRTGGFNLVKLAILPGIIWLIIWQMDPENPRSIIEDGALTQYDQGFVKAIGEAVRGGQSSSGPLTAYDRTRAEAIAAVIKAQESANTQDKA